MRIGFDISQTGAGKAGCGYFADSLVQHLSDIDRENRYILYPTFGDFFWDPNWRKSTRRITSPVFSRGEGHASLENAQAFWTAPPNDMEERLGKPDIVHSNNFFCPRGLKTARLVYTLYDLSFLEHPEWHTEENRCGCFSGVFNASLYADLIISISESSRQHFLDVFPHFPPERIVVVHLASRFSPDPGLPRPPSLTSIEPERFWLSVGTIEPRKNHLRLLEAYAELKKMGKAAFPLVLAGGAGWLMRDFRAAMQRMKLENDVIMPGYLDNSALQWLYQNCYALVYPSLFEGFGLPVLEAMSLGAPVISSNTTSIPEIVADAGILANPLDTGEILAAMSKLHKDRSLRGSMRERGMQRARLFSWETAARKVLECYKTCTPRSFGQDW